MSTMIKYEGLFNALDCRGTIEGVAMGSVIIFIGLLFCFCETWYFGGHWHPSCATEKICDVISCITVWSGIFLCEISRLKKEK